MTGKNRRHYHCKALNSLLCADVPLRNYSLTHSPWLPITRNNIAVQHVTSSSWHQWRSY